jgi:hypothetical protein
MTPEDRATELAISRRRLLAAAGLGAGAAAAPLVAPAAAEGAGVAADPAAPPVAGLHLQFGADASSQMAVSWHTLQPVRRPRVLLGRLDGRLEQTVGRCQVDRPGTNEPAPHPVGYAAAVAAAHV